MPDHSKSYPSKTASGTSAFGHGLGDFASNANPDSALTKAMVQDMVKSLTGGSVTPKIPFDPPAKGLLIDKKDYEDYSDFQVMDGSGQAQNLGEPITAIGAYADFPSWGDLVKMSEEEFKKKYVDPIIDQVVSGIATSMAFKAAEELNKIWSEMLDQTAQEIAARPPATAPFDWAKDLEQPKEFWIYEIQYRDQIPARPFNDGWGDWRRDVRHPSQYSTERRAKNALAKRVERRARIVNQPFEFRIQPVYFGHAPNFRWERKSRKKPKPIPFADPYIP